MESLRLLKLTLVPVILCVVIAILAICFLRGFGPSARDVQRIVLISIDTCRADHLGCYGYSRPTTPNIDAVAHEGILFENTIAPVPLTLPSHCSMLTGTIPPYHGVHDNLNHRLANFNVTLAEVLREEGFTCGAVMGAFVLDSQFGLDQGFETYNDRFDKGSDPDAGGQRGAGEVSRYGSKWLEEHADDRFFLFLHYFDPHERYEPPPAFALRFADNLYAGEIAYVDQCIGLVIRKLKDMGIYDSTLIIITGDHGEMLGEHGEQTHGYFVYQSAIKVPLILKLPGQKEPRRVQELVGLIDVLPTVCRLAGVEPPAVVQGQDLGGYFQKTDRPGRERHLFCESLVPTKSGANSLLGLVTERWKYIETTRRELYDLVEDPQEADNLVGKEPERVRVLEERLRGIVAARLRPVARDGRLEPDAASRRRLESLGYIAGAGVSEDFTFDRSKEDPKDLITFHTATLAALTLNREKKYEQARSLCEKLIEERPHAFVPYVALADITMKQQDFPAAVSASRQALEIDPHDGSAHRNLGNALLGAGRLEEAVTHFREALRIIPWDAAAHYNLGNALHSQGKLEEAISHYREALRLRPYFSVGHCNLGMVLYSQGKLEEAISHYREAVRQKPEYAEKYNNLGYALMSQGKIEEAISHYRQALRLTPGMVKIHVNLGDALVELRRFEDAIGHYDKALRLNPNDPEARERLTRVRTMLGNKSR